MKRTVKKIPVMENAYTRTEVTYTFGGDNPVTIAVGTTNDASNTVTIYVGGLAHPNLKDDGPGFVGFATKDPRLLEVVKDFAKKLEAKLDLTNNPVRKGTLFKSDAPVTIGQLTNGNADEVRLTYSFPSAEVSFMKPTATLFARMDAAVNELAPEMEKACAQARSLPLPKRNERGENVNDEVTRKHRDAIAGLPVQEGVAREIEKRHGIAYPEALKIAKTAIDALREQGQLKPPPGNGGVGGSYNN